MQHYTNGQPYLISGETFNEIADAIRWIKENRFRLSEKNSGKKKYCNGEVRIKCSAALPSFSPVTLTGLAVINPEMRFDVPTFYAAPASGADPAAVFAVTTEPASPDNLTKAVVSGVVPAKVTILDPGHQFACPDPENSGNMISCAASSARILCAVDEQWCILQLGAGSDIASSYDGPFALSLQPGDGAAQIRCSGGLLNRNGEILEVPPGMVAAQTGYVCVESTLDDGGTHAVWSSPAYIVSESVSPGQYPVGFCTVEESGPRIKQYYTAMAVIIITGECPIDANS